MARSQKSMAGKKGSSKGISTGLIIVFAVLAIVTGILAFIIVRNIVNSWTMTDLPGVPQVSEDGSPVQVTLEGTEYVAPLQTSNDPTAEPWDGASRVTILMMGLDFRDWESGETPRTDTMILLTMDPLSKTAGMLSIPRDLWVNIPGFDHGKINTAYYLGEIYNLPGGGPGLAVDTVEQVIGVPINYYAQIDFYAFAEFIDELGGLDMHIKDPITVDPIGPGNTVTLQPGVQVLDGATALAYARARYTDGGDFDRSRRQQEVILALRDDIVNFNMLPTLISKAPALYNDLSSGIRTNLNLQQVIQLALFASQIDPGDIKQGIIGQDEVMFGTSPDGLSIVIPIYDEIRLVRDEIFSTGGPVSPAAVSGDPATLRQDEQAKISIQNGTSSSGLATQTAEYLRSQGINIIEETNADRLYSASTIIIYNGKPYTTQYIADLMGIATANIYNRYTPDAYADIAIILGDDWLYNNPMQQ